MDAPRDPLRHISDTALWVAIYRAMESERSDAIFRDPYARRLGGDRGEAIVGSIPRGRAMAWPMIVRTAVMDEIIGRVIDRNGARSVLNLAAGLDTRPYRLSLPESLRWFHVDLPDMVDHVRRTLGTERAVCRVEYVASDLTAPQSRAAALGLVADEPGPTLAITEGLLVYLQPAEVALLAQGLADTPSVRWWLIDLASPRLLEMLRKSWQPRLTAASAPMVFAPEEGTRFFEPFGWREVEFRSMWEEAIRLNRGPRGAWIWRIVSRLMSRSRREQMRKLSGIVLLERA
jgi:methyltransferase (TIGR00027 family)